MKNDGDKYFDGLSEKTVMRKTGEILDGITREWDREQRRLEEEERSREERRDPGYAYGILALTLAIGYFLFLFLLLYLLKT